MTRHAEITETVGARIKKFRLANGFTQGELARLAGVKQPQIAEYEGDDHKPVGRHLRDIASALKVLPRVLTTDRATRALMADAWSGNPKPYQLGDITIEGLYDILGGPTEEMRVSVKYNNDALQVHGRIAPIYEKIDRMAKEKAIAAKAQYWDGPHTRLMQIGEETSGQKGAGHEERGVVLHVEPVSWFEYTKLNNYLDEPELFDGEPDLTIRKCLADTNMLYSNPKDWSWCALSNIMCVSMIPITSDGFGIIQRRSTSCSVGAGRLISGVSENIHRWLDEAPAHDLWQRVNPLVPLSEQKDRGVDRTYSPASGNVPSPYLAAQRGFSEELAWVRQMMEGSHERFKFLALAADLEFFHPVLVGVIDLPYTREEAEKTIRRHRGKDHSEGLGCLFVPMKSDDKEILKIVQDPGDWVLCGLAALIMAVRYWEFRHQH
jgi:transcriptional regulator with XRE-family HTH domain